MSVAFVVPAIRLRRDTTGWSYRVPATMVLQAGSLVVIPFRGHATLGVVWEISDKDDRASVAISEVLTPQPLLRAAHRETVEWLSQAGLCSLSTALYTWLPRALRKLPLTGPAKEELERFNAFHPTPQIIALAKQHLVCVAGRRPEQEASLAAKFGERFATLFAYEGETAELARWVDIATGAIQLGLGRENGLLAPWLNLRHLTLVEPEDISFYHEQTPYLSMVDLARELARVHKAEVATRSYLPQAASELAWGTGTLGSKPEATVRITDLRKEPLVSAELVVAIQETLSRGKTVLLLHNAHDRLVQEEDKSQKLLPGIETVRRQLAHALGAESLPKEVVLESRVLFHRPHTNVGLTAVLNCDYILRAQLFADQLHGWSDLGHLLAYPVPCWVQTYRPEHQLVVALANRMFEPYVLEQVRARKEASLPPFAEELVASAKGDVDAATLYAQLQPLVQAPWQLSQPFTGLVRKDEYTHIMLIAPTGTRLTGPARKVLLSLKRPWRVQHNPWYVL